MGGLALAFQGGRSQGVFVTVGMGGRGSSVVAGGGWSPSWVVSGESGVRGYCGQWASLPTRP